MMCSWKHTHILVPLSFYIYLFYCIFPFALPSMLWHHTGKFLEGCLPTALIEEAASLVGMKDAIGSLQQGTSSDPSGRCYMDQNARLHGALSSALMLSYSMFPGMSSAGMTSTPSSPSSKLNPSTFQQQGSPQQETMKSAESTANIEAFTETLNTATKSAESISQDIDDLQMDIEALASHIGIDPQNLEDPVFDGMQQLGDFVDDYGAMISSASRSDKIRLYELAGGSHVKNKYDTSAPPLEKGKQSVIQAANDNATSLPGNQLTSETLPVNVTTSSNGDGTPNSSLPPQPDMPIPPFPVSIL